MGDTATPLAIGLLGDVMLGRGVAEELARGCAPAELWDEDVKALAATLDAVVVNLECCLSERGVPTGLVAGKPFFFRGPPGAAGALAALGVRAVTLANNHALDYGAEALLDTTAALDAAGIAWAGAGAGLMAARRPALVTIAGRRIALVSVTDHPAEYAATATAPGVALADLRDGVPPWLAAEIAAARASADLVIVAPHWGPNMRAAPASWQRAAAAALQEAGAHLVAGHSAHVFHGVAWTARGAVLFDLGDALDDYRVDPELRNDLGVVAVWRPGAPVERQVEVIGLRLHFARTGLARGTDAEWIAQRLAAACASLGTSVTRLAEQRFAIEPG